MECLRIACGILPHLPVASVALESHMMSASNTPNISVLKDEEGGDEMLSNGRRGGWGNLWD